MEKPELNRERITFLVIDIMKVLGVIVLFVVACGFAELLSMLLIQHQRPLVIALKRMPAQTILNGILQSLAVYCLFLALKSPLHLRGGAIAWPGKALAGRYLLYGFILATLAIGSVALICRVEGLYAYTSSSYTVGGMLILLLFYLLAALVEELLFRAIILQMLLRRQSAGLAVVLSSVIFAAMHLANPNMSMLSFVNLFFAGVIMSLLYLAGGKNILLPLSFHLFWNFIQGPVSGFRVSGNDLGMSLLRPVASGKELLFGLEGTWACFVLSILLIAYLLWRHAGELYRPVPSRSNFPGKR